MRHHSCSLLFTSEQASFNQMKLKVVLSGRQRDARGGALNAFDRQFHGYLPVSTAKDGKPDLATFA
jgi:hypothetical protein